MASLEPVTQHRTQLYLSASLYQKVKQKVNEEGISMAEFFRSLLEAEFEKGKKRKKMVKKKAWQEFFKLAGIGNSGLKDISVNHDKYLVNDELKSWEK